MTRYRILVKHWYHHSSLDLCCGSLKKSVPLYTPAYDFDDALAVKKLCLIKGLDKGIDDLAKVALVAGAYSRLWVGSLDGTLVPMDRPPTGWTYPNGEPVEPSWFWQWKPSEASEQTLLTELADPNPLREAKGVLKTLMPHNKARDYGDILAIEAIDLVRLVGMVKTNIPWLFEFDFNPDIADA